jgi:hypothetical protein
VIQVAGGARANRTSFRRAAVPQGRDGAARRLCTKLTPPRRRWRCWRVTTAGWTPGSTLLLPALHAPTGCSQVTRVVRLPCRHCIKASVTNCFGPDDVHHGHRFLLSNCRLLAASVLLPWSDYIYFGVLPPSHWNRGRRVLRVAFAVPFLPPVDEASPLHLQRNLACLGTDRAVDLKGARLRVAGVGPCSAGHRVSRCG